MAYCLILTDKAELIVGEWKRYKNSKLITTAILFSLGLFHCQNPIKKENKKEIKMETSIAETLRQISSDDSKRLDSIVHAIQVNGFKEISQVVSLMHSRDSDMANKAFGIALDVGPLALNPILDSLNPDKPKQTVLELRHTLDLVQTDRARLASILNKLMDDKQNVPLPEQPANTEEKLTPRRLCDEAYLMLRRLLSQEESADDQLLNAKLFFELSEADRDKEIAKVRKSKTFSILSGYFPGEESLKPMH